MPDESDISAGPTDEPTPDELELETFDVDGDGKIGVIDTERNRLGLLDARLEQIAEEGGVIGSLAGAAHNLVDRLDNDSDLDDEDH
jgi:hypothetical protein